MHGPAGALKISRSPRRSFFRPRNVFTSLLLLIKPRCRQANCAHSHLAPLSRPFHSLRHSLCGLVFSALRVHLCARFIMTTIFLSPNESSLILRTSRRVPLPLFGLEPWGIIGGRLLTRFYACIPRILHSFPHVCLPPLFSSACCFFVVAPCSLF